MSYVPILVNFMTLKERINLWYNAVRHPLATFKKQKSHADYEEGAINVISGSVIGQVLRIVTTAILIFAAISLTRIGAEELFEKAVMRPTIIGSFTPLSIVLEFVVGLAAATISWLGGGWIFYKISRWLGGKGNLKTQLYLVSLYCPGFGVMNWFALFIITAGSIGGAITKNVVAMFGGIITGVVLILLLLIYQIYCFVYALVETHNYSAGQGAGTCIIGVLIIGAIAFGLMMLGFLGYGLLFGSIF